MEKYLEMDFHPVFSEKLTEAQETYQDKKIKG